MRTGEEYLASLDDGREVYIDGARVTEVGSHPALAGAARTVAGLYDLAADPRSGMTYVAPETGREANLVFSIPRSREDLAARRGAIETWARFHHGWLGRGPDHVGSFLAGFGASPGSFASAPHDLAANVSAHYRRLLDESLFVAYAIIPPQFSRDPTDQRRGDDPIQAAVVGERPEGLVVRGAQMLATGAAIADELLVSCIKPLAAGEETFAVSFLVPLATKGMRLYCRRSYAAAATSAFDYPLSTRYDETDALVVFDDVLVPWERVFVDRDIAGLRRQFFETGAHVLGNTQAQIRLVAKLRFLLGLARKATAVNVSDRIPGVQEKLGELASLASLVESSVLAAEYRSVADANGMWRPDARALYGAMGLQAELYPRVLAILRDLVGGGVLQLPATVHEMLDPWTRRDIDRYVRSPGVEAEDRVKLFKLIWDAVGSEFAGRHHQYEMFYAGAPFVAKGYAYRNYGYEESVAEVEAFLSTYKVEQPTGRP